MNVILSDDQDDPLEPDLLATLAANVLEAEGLADDTIVEVTFIDEAAMAARNREAMDKDGPTDVLAFPLEDASPGSPPLPSPGGPPIHIGDVLICPAVVRSNASAAGVRFDDELALMVVHGVLHLLGYDHVEDGEAEQMEARERELLAAVGLVRP